MQRLDLDQVCGKAGARRDVVSHTIAEGLDQCCQGSSSRRLSVERFDTLLAAREWLATLTNHKSEVGQNHGEHPEKLTPPLAFHSPESLGSSCNYQIVSRRSRSVSSPYH
jgi:hypothetical protein